ncbi:hypothetical protein DRJ48_03525, partial [Candidatus Woesearchaeota archaeon]
LCSYIGYLGARHLKLNAKFVEWLFALVSILPVGTLLAIRTLTYTFFVRGALVQPTYMFLYLFLVMLPFCFLNGFLVVVVAQLYPITNKPKRAGFVVFLDNIGDMLGGLLFSFVLVYFLNTFQISLLLLILGLCVAAISSLFRHRRWLSTIFCVLILMCVILLTTVDLDKLSLKTMFKGQTIVENRFTPYGNLVVTKLGDQYNLFENGMLYTNTNDRFRAEAVVHYPMLQVKNPKSVLLISGGISGTLLEILKYNVSEIDYVELDPKVIQLGKSYFNLPNDSRVRYYNIDGRLFMKTTPKFYDVIILDLGSPLSAQLNRFYTDEFFNLVKSNLKPSGVFSFHLPGGENYLSSELADFHSIIIATGLRHFDNFIAIPGSVVYYVFSDNKLSYNYTQLLALAKINTTFVNQNYLKGIITKDRLASFMVSIKPSNVINTDLRPVGYHYMLRQWLKQFNSNLLPLALLILLLLFFYLRCFNPVSFAVFTSGFSGMALEFVLILVFQVAFGYVYSQIGLIIACFMFGLVVGSFIVIRHMQLVKQLHIVLIELCFLVLFSVIILMLSRHFIPALGIYLANILLGLVVGLEFLIATKLKMTKVRITLSEFYMADAIGSAIGALTTAVIIVPMLGLIGCVWVLFGVKLLSLVLLLNRKI